ncbi:hypothetical protein GCM10010303_16290 [Streptomyces purpurascens]|nr:hypothetical protein GCM10010303_16290 [Streptomyces purpurascens]
MASYEAWVAVRNSGLSARTGRTLSGPCVSEMNKTVFPARGVVSVERMVGYRSRDGGVADITLRGVR